MLKLGEEVNGEFKGIICSKKIRKKNFKYHKGWFWGTVNGYN